MSPWWEAWYGLVIAAAAAALVAVLAMGHRKFGTRPEARRLLLLVVVVCAVGVYRAALPVQYSTRKVWHDTPLGATVTVRALAMIAELAMIVAVHDAFGGGWPMQLAVGLVALAQVPGTIGAATTRPWLFAAEETLWALAGVAVLVAAALTLAERRSGGGVSNGRALAIGAMVAMSIYLGFQAWALTEAWSEAGAPPTSALPWTSTALVERTGYGAVHAAWSTGYFAVLPWLLAGIVYLV